MLFRPVYGSELAVIYEYLCVTSGTLNRQGLYHSLQAVTEAAHTSPQNIDDALAFLVACRLVDEKERVLYCPSVPKLPFALLVLRQLRALALGELAPLHPLDPLYLRLVEWLFLHSDRDTLSDLHAAANGLTPIAEQGGVSREKMQAWKRVMVYLGVGQSVGRGFSCLYSPDLLRAILACWVPAEGSLQAFFEEHFSRFLPIEGQGGKLTRAVQPALLYLHAGGEIRLEARADSSTRAYFGASLFRYLTYQGGAS